MWFHEAPPFHCYQPLQIIQTHFHSSLQVWGPTYQPDITILTVWNTIQTVSFKVILEKECCLTYHQSKEHQRCIPLTNAHSRAGKKNDNNNQLGRGLHTKGRELHTKCRHSLWVSAQIQSRLDLTWLVVVSHLQILMPFCRLQVLQVHDEYHWKWYTV